MFSSMIVLSYFIMYSIHIGELALIIDDSRYIVKAEAINLDEYYKISPISVTNLTHFYLSCGYEGDCLMGTCHYKSPNSLDAPIPAVMYEEYFKCKPSNKCYCVGDTTQKPESVTVKYDNKLHVKIMRSSSMVQTIRNNDNITLELYFMTPSCEITNLAFHRGLKSLYDDKWIYPLIKNVPPPKGWSHSTITKMTLTMTNVQVTDNGYYEMKIQCGMVIVNYPFLLYVLSNFTITDTKVYDAVTNNSHNSPFWIPMNTYNVICQIKSGLLVNDTFTAYKKECTLKNSCDWKQVTDDKSLVIVNGIFEKMAVLKINATEGHQSYNIKFGQQDCMHGEYYPSYVPNGISMDPLPQTFIGQEVELNCRYDAKYFDFSILHIRYSDHKTSTLRINDTFERHSVTKKETMSGSLVTLTIRDLIFKDSGIYECLFNKQIDGRTTRLTVNVTVTDKPFFSESRMASGKSNIILIILIAIICLLTILGAVQTRRIWQDRKLKSRLSDLQRDIHSRAISLQNLLPRLQPFKSTVVNNLYIDPRQYIKKQLLTIELDKPLGAGCFGLVYQGLLRCDYQNDPLPVAVKTPKFSDNISHFEALIAELTIMSNIGSHVNLLGVYGAVIENLHLGQLFVVFEICEKGSLSSYIQSKLFVDEFTLDYQNVNFDRHTLSEKAACLSDNVGYPFSTSYIFTCNLLQNAYQIADGMDYISRYVIHRDLALRNMLLTNNHIVKIADFGLALDFSSKVSNVERLPIRWMPPEAICRREFSTHSDVWSFGVVLWELFTLGQEPFEDCRIFNLETMESFCNQLISGRRLNCPVYCPPEIYTLMKECWSIDKEDRPSFEECKSIIGCYLSEKFPSATNVLINLLRNSQPYVDVRRSQTRQTISPENSTYLTVIEENVYVNDNLGN